MKHAAPLVTATSGERPDSPSCGTSEGKAEGPLAQMGRNGATVDVDEYLAISLDQASLTSRRSIRLARQAKRRRSHILVSASLAALVGAAATSMSLNPALHGGKTASADAVTTSTLKPVGGSSVSRSQERSSLSDGGWTLGDTNTFVDVDKMSLSKANNPNVAKLMDSDRDLLPQSFNPNHPTGDSGNAYEFSECTWWAYMRRQQLGLPVGSHMGNGNMWANSARALGFWVDNTPRHVGDVIAFASGQAGSDAVYGHVAIVEKINEDGSIVTSESGASLAGKTFSRTFSAKDAAAFQYIHY
ncbi:CHAP domain-containing protein [Bifidobacterium aemilianum]|uniref:CHAP domain-containing protein n=1 Tax=Bifidobacterium aemilianum TaxID=2493120 RepID=A0A366K6M6_9BIFI|nr:CHAP domain-containing protein [Bifidobacterium aemilianum]RBP97396.1 CHAP domain-containing protein [Bifidobacterium aemilianum]